MKQISRVYEAVLAGAVTSDQIAAMTGLDIPTVSSNYLPDLVRNGLIRRTHTQNKRAGRLFHRYEPVAGRPENLKATSPSARAANGLGGPGGCAFGGVGVSVAHVPKMDGAPQHENSPDGQENAG